MVAVGEWLEAAFLQMYLEEECEGYLLGRGVREEWLREWGVGQWAPPREGCPDPLFSRRYGSRGESLRGWVTIPLRAPTGALVGVEFRSYHEKRIHEFRLAEAAWNPVLFGSSEAVSKLYQGGNVWVVEGFYDLAAVRWGVPETDAVVTTLRAALDARSVQFLARWCRGTVFMAYDNDDTGRRATLGWNDKETGRRRRGALELLRRAGLVAVDWRYRGKDPGEVWRQRGLTGIQAEFGAVSILP